MILDGKTQYCQDISSSKLEVQIRRNPNQNPRKFFGEYQQTDSRKRKTQKSRPSVEGEGQSGGPTLPCAEAHDARRKARRSRRRGAGEGADRAVAGAGWTVGRHRRGRGEGNAMEQRRSPQQRCWGSWTSTCEDRNLHADLTPFTRSAQKGPRT